MRGFSLVSCWDYLRRGCRVHERLLSSGGGAVVYDGVWFCDGVVLPALVAAMRRFGSKYGNRSGSCSSCHAHDSRAEAAYCEQLKALVRAKEILGYDAQVTFPLVGINGHTVCTHRVDFVVRFRDGGQEVHEVKGLATDVWQLKRKLFIDNHPAIPYVVINARGIRCSRRN